MREQQLRELGTLARCEDKLHKEIDGYCGVMDGEVHLLQDEFLKNFDTYEMLPEDERHNAQLQAKFNGVTYYCLYEEDK